MVLRDAVRKDLFENYKILSEKVSNLGGIVQNEMDITDEMLTTLKENTESIIEELKTLQATFEIFKMWYDTDNKNLAFLFNKKEGILNE